MCALAPTVKHRGRGEGALLAMLATGGAVLALFLAALVLGPAEPPRSFAGGARLSRGEASSCSSSEQRPVCLQPRTLAPEDCIAAVGTSSALQLQQQGFSPRSRTGFPPDPRAVHRAVRERLEALVTARERGMRAPGMPVSAGYPADRPPLVTRPLRGPPARG